MLRTAEPGRLRRMSLVLLGWVLAGWPAVAPGQEAVLLPPPTAPARLAPLSPGASPELLERLGQMEQRLEWLTKQNEALLRENKVLAEKGESPFRAVSNPNLQGLMISAPSGTGPTGVTAPPAGGTGAFSSAGPVAAPASPRTGGQPGSASDGSDRGTPHTLGGGSKASGGDPTTTGRAQEVGNRHLGKVPLKIFYDFDDEGFHWVTDDREYGFGVRGMTQLDSRIYRYTGANTPVNGFYNPRTRFYFEGHFTKPISYEFSFQNTFDNVNLLDAYVNFNYDERFQVRLGRFKTPFTYEWYRVHVWDLLAPERSLFANNFESNRRFGLMGWGVLADQRIEYAVGTFNSQRNSFQPFNNRQDLLAFLNFKPFYNREEGFLLRDLHVGGSVDAGNENQPTLPAALRTNSAPSGNAVDSSSAGNSATLPFLAFNPGVLERGGRALWELHVAYYYGGLSLLGAWQSGHESYALAADGPRTQVPIDGWFVQGGYLLTGETIRDRTLIQPLRPFDLRKCQFGIGAWEVTARYSQLHLDPRVFTAGLADPTMWTNNAKLVDVGVNWYLNQFVKIYFDWEHASFGSPVVTSPGRFRTSNDMFWVRTQVYF